MILDNIRNGREDHTHAVGMPAICNMCQIPISNRGGNRWDARVYQREHEGRRYNFCTPVCEWIFTTEPDRYKHFDTIVDRMYNGTINPPTPENILRYMGSGVVSEGGQDAHNYRWGKNSTATAAE